MIIATAGHVDHGKTALVKQLTGFDTDRLAEEKRRGLSINLGYAYRQLKDGYRVGFVDVPGHQQFINTMIAGVCGIDHALLVVAADDGPMPQTLEHLNVLRVLGVPTYTAVITKVDRVDSKRLQVVEAQVKQLLRLNGIGNSPCLRVANTTGEGISELLAHLAKCAARLPTAGKMGHFRISIDRSFELKGVGLIVTGTATSGEVRANQNLRLLPLERMVRVRSLNVQDERAQVGRRGDRCALNIVGEISKDEIKRGFWLVDESSGPTTKRIDARIELFADATASVRHLSPLKVYLGAGHYEAQPYLIAANRRPKEIAAGESSLVQLIFDREISCYTGERFVLRDNSETLTLGGGKIIDPYAPQWRKSTERRLAYLDAMASADPQRALYKWLTVRGDWLDRERFAHAWNLRDDEMQSLLANSEPAQIVETRAGRKRLLIPASLFRSTIEWLLGNLSTWHRENPLKGGIAVAELRKLTGMGLAQELFEAALETLISEGKLGLQSGLLRVSGHRATVEDAAEQMLAGVLRLLARYGTRIPSTHELAAELSVDPKALIGALSLGVKLDRLYKVTPQRYVTPEVLYPLAKELERLAQEAEVSVRAFCDGVGIGRNLAIELLEYFDRVRFTVRRGNARKVLNRAWLSSFLASTPSHDL